MFDWSDPAVTWLVITNFVMGAVVLACCILLVGAIAKEVLMRRRVAADDHAFALPELGLTMADGGEREDKAPPRRKR